ncbi:actin-like ATPase domain-containing protein [Gymnopus androsaceus JB14]|uniref:Actin-like ATPase domain-containing protein n=1 Tax=Gymnopus androsaceus JB14 TaxID=1447944 RepID=A0A6A4HL75_9AGAR|nr:actin-like ATPase domain-containing protein [Gymnopus androsaceus JB14]
MDIDMDIDAESNITPAPFPTLPNIPPGPSDYSLHRNNHTPLIIDNGSTTLRWGFATSDSPEPSHFGPNIITKYRERKNNKPLVLFGDAVEVESAAKALAKTPWEGDVLLNFDALENALDYAFVQLGIDTPAVDHPVLMTERLCSPAHSRALTSELMFEQYSVPCLAYCIDGVMSFYQNNHPTAASPSEAFASDGLVVSFNTASTSVIPILNGKGILSHAKRIPWGASQSSDYLLKLIQVKYPTFPTRVTVAQSNWMLRTFCSVSPDYNSLLRSFEDHKVLRASERVIQFPFILPGNSLDPNATERTEEELAKISEKRKEQGRKLQELARKNRVEKLNQKESDLTYLLALREAHARGDFGNKASSREWLRKLEHEGFDDEESFEETIKKLEGDVKKGRKKESEKEREAAGMDVDDGQPLEEPSFPLVDVPDAELSSDSLKEKKKQRLLKAGYEARVRIRKEKEIEKQLKEKEEREQEERDKEERENDLGGWARRLRGEQETLMTRIKDRARRKAALSDRKSAAAQARMKSIANLALDDRVPKKEKRRKGGGEDTFGADDADWAIYRKININADDSDEDNNDDRDLAQLQLIESKLLTWDPTFTMEETHASIASQRSALLNAFKPVYEEGDVGGKTRIHLNTERWRACEPWFSPGMAGVDSAGLGEVIQNVLSRFSEEEKGRMVKNISLTGSPSLIPGISPRLYSTLRPLLPPEMPIEIRRADDPGMDAWRGMARFARGLTSAPQTEGEFGMREFEKIGMTRAEYDEMGGERMKRWWGGNWNGGY